MRELQDRIPIVVVMDPLLAGDERVGDGEDLVSNVERQVALVGSDHEGAAANEIAVS